MEQRWKLLWVSFTYLYEYLENGEDDDTKICTTKL